MDTAVLLKEMIPWLTDPDAWQHQAACASADPDIFTVEESKGGKPRKESAQIRHEHWQQAKRICASCLVQSECLEAATASDRLHTVRGGQPAGLDAELLEREGKRSLSPDQLRLALDMWIRGHQQTDIGEAFGVSIKGVNGWRREREKILALPDDCDIAYIPKKDGRGAKQPCRATALARSSDGRIMHVVRKNFGKPRASFVKSEFVTLDNPKVFLPTLETWLPYAEI